MTFGGLLVLYHSQSFLDGLRDHHADNSIHVGPRFRPRHDALPFCAGRWARSHEQEHLAPVEYRLGERWRRQDSVDSSQYLIQLDISMLLEIFLRLK